MFNTVFMHIERRIKIRLAEEDGGEGGERINKFQYIGASV